MAASVALEAPEALSTASLDSKADSPSGSESVVRKVQALAGIDSAASVSWPSEVGIAIALPSGRPELWR